MKRVSRIVSSTAVILLALCATRMRVSGHYFGIAIPKVFAQAYGQKCGPEMGFWGGWQTVDPIALRYFQWGCVDVHGNIKIGGNVYASGGAGSDIGARLNYIYTHDLPARGGTIIVQGDGSCLDFSTPVRFGTAGKYVLLEGGGGGGISSRFGSGAVCLNYTPITGAAFTLDYVAASVGTYVPAHGFRDITLLNNKCFRTEGCGSSAFGIVFSGSNWGASNAEMMNVSIIGFGFGYVNENPANIPGITWINPLFEDNGIAITNGANTNNLFLGGFFLGNFTAIQTTATLGGEYELIGTGFAMNGGPVIDATRSTTNVYFSCSSCHFEDSPISSSSSPHFIVGPVNVRLFGGVMESDQATGAQDYFVSSSGTAIQIYGLELLSAGKSFDQAFQLDSSKTACSIVLSNESPTLVRTLVGGAGAGNAYVMSLGSGTPHVNAQFAKTMLDSSVAPLILNGFGNSASILQENGTAAFEVSVGSGTATSGAIGLPSAANGWSCQAADMTTDIATRETDFTPTSVTLTAAKPWTPGDKLLVDCAAF
ncbi:MAG TPA: hypothetical protein VMF66_01325 [Candidatus Acidoferrum sp.]|nr:hypothetical protein [Candidatus Acidoferrum sp.]